MMSGNNALKSVDGSIYTYKIAPNGKLAYIVTEEKTNSSGEIESFSYVVYDGKEGKRYDYINELKFMNGSELFYTAADSKSKYVIVNGSEVISQKYDNVYGFSHLPNGKFTYVGTNYGDYQKRVPDKNYVFIGDERFGPYDVVYTNDWETYAVVIWDNKGNYAYTAGKEADYENYYFRYRVYTNKWKSKQYDNIPALKVHNGHVVYFAGNQVAKGVYVYDTYLFIVNKKTGESYSSVTDIKIDASGRLSFMASRGSSIYLVEVQL
jgi:hypothetical protein